PAAGCPTAAAPCPERRLAWPARLARMIGAGASGMPNRAARLVARIDHARGGLAVDVVLYVAGALFGGLTAANPSLPPHPAWGRVGARWQGRPPLRGSDWRLPGPGRR